jgi:hypothetical protein
MSEPCTVVIGSPELLPALRERIRETGDVLTFSDQEPLRALEAIVARRPQIVAFERLFAATSRGAALINRIKADPLLTDAEIRVVSHDSDYMRVSPRPRHTPGGATVAVEAPATPRQPLDWRGTRRAPRVRITDDIEVMVDGNTALLVDLSAIGAQVISPVVLRPNQRVRMALADDTADVRFNASVSWASFEMANGMPRYRAGIEFADADGAAVTAFGERHR